MNKEIRGYIDEILYILKGFKVPSTNNNAETSQRGAKIKQKLVNLEVRKVPKLT